MSLECDARRFQNYYHTFFYPTPSQQKLGSRKNALPLFQGSLHNAPTTPKSAASTYKCPASPISSTCQKKKSHRKACCPTDAIPGGRGVGPVLAELCLRNVGIVQDTTRKISVQYRTTITITNRALRKEDWNLHKIKKSGNRCTDFSVECTLFHVRNPA